MSIAIARNPDGVRSRHIASKENRVLPYSDWHRSEVGRGYYALDSDLIEWRIRGGQLVPVAVTELTRVDLGVVVSRRYLDAILNRYNTTMQGKTARYLAEALRTKAWIVLFREDCSEFWLYPLSDGGKWQRKDSVGMLAFLRGL